MESFFFGSESTIEMINNIIVKDAKDFYMSKGLINLDIDGQYALVDLSSP